MVKQEETVQKVKGNREGGVNYKKGKENMIKEGQNENQGL